MPNYLTSVAAATAVVGYDLLVNEVHARSPKHRTLNAVALKGSAAAMDTIVEMYIDEVRVGKFGNTGTGVPNKDDLFMTERNIIPAGAQIRAIVTDAPATNPIQVMLTLEDL